MIFDPQKCWTLETNIDRFREKRFILMNTENELPTNRNTKQTVE